MAKNRSKRQLNALPLGHQLHWYEIREILGQGGFGITYLANDQNLAHEVAIKEYFPIDLATRGPEGSVEPLSPDFEERYRWGLERFIDEARTIGQFKHPNIVRVRNVFEANNTAYMVMDYELGESLQEILSRRKILDEPDIETVVFPIVDGMKLVHAHGFIHRDIKPANIFIRVDGEPVLLDFGSARQALEESRNSLTSIFSKGYAPIEQYNTNEDQQGPWTDIYALGATMYRAIAGVPPSDAIDRSSAISLASRDTYVSAKEIGQDRYSAHLLDAIDYAMQFRKQDRPQTISEWQSVLMGRVSVAEDKRSREETPGPAAAVESDEFSKELQLAELGDAAAQASVAFKYAKGIDTGRDDFEAMRWYRMAAEQDDIGAQFNLGVIYAKGRGVEQDYAEALKWYLRAAEQGDMNAQATVAKMYLKGIGTERDLGAAFDWCRRAAKRGHLNSLFIIGEMYARGLGVQENQEEALRWYKKAAERGHTGAQLALAYMLGKGQGTERDDVEAYQWYLQAAEAGDPIAQYNLGVIYAKGRGIERDAGEARKWYALAANQGVEGAQRALDRLSSGT